MSLYSSTKRGLKGVVHHGRVLTERTKHFGASVLGRERQRTQIVVCGYPRSGTSLFYNMLGSTLRAFTFERGERSALDTLWKYRDCASKDPLDTFRLERIVDNNIHQKKLVLLLCIRDPRDIITSYHPFDAEHYVMSYDFSLAFEGEYPNYQSTRDGPGLKRYFKAVRAAIEHGRIDVLEIRYEELVTDPDAVQDEIRRSTGLAFERLFSEYDKWEDRHPLRYEGRWAPTKPELAKSSDPVSAKYVGRWRKPQHRTRILEQFTEHPELFDMLRYHGYESTDDWFPPDCASETEAGRS